MEVLNVVRSVADEPFPKLRKVKHVTYGAEIIVSNAGPHEVGTGMVRIGLDVARDEQIGLRCRRGTCAGEVLVSTTAPESPSQKAGIMPGWRLWSVNCNAVRSMTQVAEQLHTFRLSLGTGAKRLSLEFVRPLPAGSTSLHFVERDCALLACESLARVRCAQERLAKRSAQPIR